jgi:topoisomerase-4 subunit A
MYYDSLAKTNYIKRFNIETSTLDKEFHFMGEGNSAKLLLITLHEGAIFKFNYHSATGQKKTKEIKVDDFVTVKGWKSIGNKIPPHKRMSGFEIIVREVDGNDPEDINKKENLGVIDDNPDSDTLNLFE